MKEVVIENPAWRNREHVYADRSEAGRVVAGYLEQYAARDPIVLAIPAGGVPVGLEIARALGAPFDVIIIRKIPIPGNTEAGFGAVSLEGDVLLDEKMVKAMRLNEKDIENLAAPVRKDVEERNRLFRAGRPFPKLAGKTAILVDDGLAAGYTMTVAAKVIRRKGPAAVVIAVPTAPAGTIARIEAFADSIVCPNIREGYPFAVASAYEEWRDLGRAEVLALLQNAPWPKE